MRNIIRRSYFYLLVVFLISVFLLEFKVISVYSLNFYIFAVILGCFGFFLENEYTNYNFPQKLLFVAVILTLVLRIIPYFINSVPLGYDPGLYKYLFEHPFGEEWLKGTYPLLFTVVMGALSSIFTSYFIMVPLLIYFSAVTCFAIYFVGEKLFKKDVGVLSAVLFMVSVTQYQTFLFFYYKNIIGIILLLLSLLYFTKEDKLNWRLILIGVLIAGVHSPALFIFGMTYFIYVMSEINIKDRNWWYSVENGMWIFILAFVINFDRIGEYIIPGIFSVANSVIEFSGGAGTFFSITDYFFYSLPFIPFAITGLFFYRKVKQLLIATIVTFVFVIFELFFHNRLIIYLDIFVIIYAALGFQTLIANKNWFGKMITYGFIILLLVQMSIVAVNSKPLISESEFEKINKFNNYVTQESTVIATDSYYGPWLKGYLNAKVISPGLFDDKINRTEWDRFWLGDSRQELLNRYEKPVYVHVGERQPQYTFDQCFENVTTGFYQYIC